VVPQPGRTRYSAIVAALARPADIRALPLPIMHLVMAMRLCGLFEQAGREPLVELTTRFASVTIAEQVLAIAQLIGRSWPERFVSARPCCLRLSPDERTLANLARAGLMADRDRFDRELDGFVRKERREPLYAQLVQTLAALSQLQQRA
jgi:tRNA pseudouridine-54 N-methylase